MSLLSNLNRIPGVAGLLLASTCVLAQDVSIDAIAAVVNDEVVLDSDRRNKIPDHAGGE